jgi:large subunit ribosomal protein L10
VVKPIGVNPNESVKIKKELFGADSAYNVVKNSLFKIALKNKGLPGGEFFTSGEYAVAFTNDKISEAAKVIAKFVKDTEKMEIIGGVLDGAVIDASQVKNLSELPSKEVLLGQLLSVINGPLRGLVTVLNGNVRQLTYALNAIKEAKAA